MNNRIIDLFNPRLPGTFGTASEASVTDLRRAKMFEPAKGKNLSPLIGCLTPEEIGGRIIRPIFAPPGDTHLFTAGPTRSGKGRGQIITNLLWWPGSAVVVDIKGENWKYTAGWRQAQGHRVIRFAPFENGSAQWNPIDQINEGCGDEPNDPKRQENARYLANLMIVPNPHAKEPYWDNAAKSLLQGLLHHVATADLSEDISGVRARTIGEVHRLLSLGAGDFKRLIEGMSKSREDWVRQTAGLMDQLREAREQNAGVKSITREHAAVWGYRRIQEVTSSSTFSFRQLRSDVPTTIYLVIPPEALSEYRGLLRVLVGSCMRELRQSWTEIDNDRPPVLFLLDEFPQLAYMQPVEEALLYMGAYGVKFWFFIQDLSQLQHYYEKTWRQFIANCAVRTFLSVSDLETAKLVSEMSGQATVINRSYGASINESDTTGETLTHGHHSSTSSGHGGGSSSSGSSFSRSFSTSHTAGRGFNANLAYVGRPLYTPDEILRMPFGAMLALNKSMPVVRGQLLFWDEWKRNEGLMLPPS